MCVCLLFCRILCCLLFLSFFTFAAFFPSVLWYCWLGHLTCKTVFQITYNVLVETVNLRYVSFFVKLLLYQSTDRLLMAVSDWVLVVVYIWRWRHVRRRYSGSPVDRWSVTVFCRWPPLTPSSLPSRRPPSCLCVSSTTDRSSSSRRRAGQCPSPHWPGVMTSHWSPCRRVLTANVVWRRSSPTRRCLYAG